ncbi:MAG: hypothetical protein WC928_03720 [Patescibacteria group bacterium]|jgi:hypothetical protein
MKEEKNLKTNFYINEFKTLKSYVEEEYRKIGSIDNPALKTKIFFNSNGLHHLKYDNNRSERSKTIQKNKFMFFSDAVAIIKKSSTTQEYRRIFYTSNKTKELKMIEFFAFWAIISFTKKIRIKVVIKRVGGEDGKFNFWSVMPFWQLNKNGRMIGSENIENE